MRGIKVYVTTIAIPFQPEQFIDVYGTHKEAENALRKEFPHMRQRIKGSNSWVSDSDASYILFVHEKEI